ncbi:alpha/beta hydrolase [Candidatus Halocynthiibacter alkanivorans]|uniref:COG3904 family protein n=1 Tax=Candidatus Halocynthiibacter alkanivorans TaxID=2267619 RepID=UPI000DF38C7F|nr:alpha/beta hydrolase [Candidatus Halocynthiibacter alkanivorans]
MSHAAILNRFRLRLIFILFGLVVLAGCSLAENIMMNARETTRFQVSGNQLQMDGIINSKTPGQLRDLLQGNPDLQEIVMGYVPGSVDDAANLVAARMVRAAGLNTRLLPGAVIASGGVEFFLAGVERYPAPGILVGVHSWSGFNVEGRDLARGDPAHQPYLAFFEDMGIDRRFYWFTLTAATSEDIHMMSPAEIARFGLFTR